MAAAPEEAIVLSRPDCGIIRLCNGRCRRAGPAVILLVLWQRPSGAVCRRAVGPETFREKEWPLTMKNE